MRIWLRTQWRIIMLAAAALVALIAAFALRDHEGEAVALIGVAFLLVVIAALHDRMIGGFSIGPSHLTGTLRDPIPEPSARRLEDDTVVNIAASIAADLSVQGELNMQLLSPEEKAALSLSIEEQRRLGPGGPVSRAWDWIAAIWRHDSLAEAWPITEENLRFALVRSWIHANRNHPDLVGYDREELADQLVNQGADAPLWSAFERTQIDEIRDKWSGFDPDMWGSSSRPRPVLPEHDLVLLTNTQGQRKVFDRPTQVIAIFILMHHTATGWLVTGLGETPADPSWPD